MSFKAIEPPEQRTIARRTGVSAGILKRALGASWLRLTFIESVISDLKWTDAGSVSVMLGEGDDAGKIRISEDGPFVLTARKMRHKFWEIKVGQLDGIPDSKTKSRPCQWRKCGKGEIEIDLPDWKDDPDDAPEADDDAPAPEPERLVPRAVAKPPVAIAPPSPAPSLAKANSAASPDDCAKVYQALVAIGGKLYADSFDIALPPLETKSGVASAQLPSALSALAANKKITAIPPKGNGKQWHIGLRQ